MRTDTVIKVEGMRVLLDRLGKVDAERFVALMSREPFDYTKWRDSLQDENISLQELSQRAMKDVQSSVN